MANIACPKCNTTLEVPAELAGQNVACPTCQTTFVVPAAAPQVAPVPAPAPAASQAGAMFNNGMAAAGNYANVALNKFKAVSAGQSVLAVVALIVAIAALVYSIFFVDSVPKVKFSKDAKTACKNYLKTTWEFEALSDYSYDKNLSLLNDINVEEVATSGDYAVVFYSIKKGASTYKATMQLKKNKDGYYMRGWGDSKNLDSEWSGKMYDKINKFTEGSVKLDTLFE